MFVFNFNFAFTITHFIIPNRFKQDAILPTTDLFVGMVEKSMMPIKPNHMGSMLSSSRTQPVIQFFTLMVERKETLEGSSIIHVSQIALCYLFAAKGH